MDKKKVDKFQRLLRLDMIEKCDETELIYKNLDFVSNAYYSAEGIFPFWESAYALIVGQLLIAYVQTSWTNEWLRALLTFSGFIFSLLWYRLVSLTRLHAKFLDHTMKRLEFKLKQKYRKQDSEFYGESPIKEIYNSSLEDIIKSFDEYNWGLFAELWPEKKARRSTWYMRRLLPVALCFIWIVLFSHSLIQILFDP
jgi:hypothetical protein